MLSGIHLKALETKFILIVDIIHTEIPTLITSDTQPLSEQPLPKTEPKYKSVAKKFPSEPPPKNPPTSGAETNIDTPITDQKNASDIAIIATETRDIKQEPIALASPQKVDSPPQKPSVADTQNKRAQYGILLSQEIAKFKQYPPASKQSRQQGIVVLQLQINSLGKLIAANVYQSSGYEPLDNQALEMVKKATPFSQPPIELREHDLSVLVPVSFRLN